MKRLFWRGLSGKLLVLTILFVMLAELLLFIPSAAIFRQNWLEQRISSAQILTLAAQGVENFKSSEALDNQFMADTAITAVMYKHDGMSELVVGMPPSTDQVISVDMREPHRLPDFGATARVYFGSGEGYLRLIANPATVGGEQLDVLIAQMALKEALVTYCHRIIALSALIAVFTGLLIYLSLSAIIVRPVQRLAEALSQFRQDPERRAGNITMSNRRDEIGSLEREFVNMKSDIRGALKQKDRLATLGLAVAKINHDLRNVLSTAQLISDRLATDNEERVRAMGERLVRAVDRGVQLCAATLSFSKSNADVPKPRHIKLATLLGEAAADAMGAGANYVNWINDVPTQMSIEADPDHIYRIFNNLFRNALSAMQAEHGSALKPAQNQTSILPRLRVDAKEISHEGGAHIIIRVLDNGPGLSQAAQASLFKPFTGSAKGGTGLGLTISRELARAQGGDLRLESSSAAGTVFSVMLSV